jgi:hypothetical protein
MAGSYLGRLLSLCAALSIACGRWQSIPLSDIEKEPSKLADEKIRVHFAIPVNDSTGVRERGQSQRSNSTSLPDSTVVLHVDRADYPILRGSTIPAARMYGSPPAPDTLQIDLRRASAIEVRAFNPVGSILFVPAILVGSLFAWLIYEIVSGDDEADWFW